MLDKNIMVTKPFMPDIKEYEEYLDQIWKNRWLTNKGPLFKKFGIQLRDYLGIDELRLTVNGHSALDIAIKALNLSGEVITTPFSFASTTHALVLNNIKPVFCDIKECDMTIDEKKIESLITDKTTAIMPVHVYGHACNVEVIEKIAKKHNLKVIYDAAHAFGVSKNGISISNYGDASIFSFHATKIFHTIEGGCVIYHDKKYSKLLDAYRNFGIYSEDVIDYIGGNSKMNEFQAAMGLVNLKHINELLQKRKELSLYYRTKLVNVSGIKYFVPENLSDFEYNYAYFPILVDKDKFGLSRDELYILLKDKNVYTRKYFYPLIPDFGCYKGKYDEYKLPISRKIAEQILCLPLYNDLSIDDINYICYTINNIKE